MSSTPEVKPNKTLASSDPTITKSSSAADRLADSSHKLTEPSQHPSVTDESGNEESKKEGGESKGGDSASGGVPVSVSAVENSDQVSNVEKKMRRAERFGMPVHLSEEEKRNSRAERFGTGSSSIGIDTSSKNSDEHKRKARAERFGIQGKSNADDKVKKLEDEETKKKARLAKFSLAPFPKTDVVEEDKRKARAARFSAAKVSSLSHVNGEGNIEPKAAIAGKADGGA